MGQQRGTRAGTEFRLPEERNKVMVQSECDRVARRMVEAMGHATQSFGVGRVLGQIFAHLYFSRESQTLDNMTAALVISKGSASMGVRQLEAWGAVEKIWVKGDRKDYYKARDAFGRIIKNAVLDLAGKRMESSSGLLAEVETQLKKKGGGEEKLSEEDKFIWERIEKIQAFQKKSQDMWNSAILQMLLR
jgi:HTH-type transcriptional regulator, glycine betaine synthesis regulator